MARDKANMKRDNRGDKADANAEVEVETRSPAPEEGAATETTTEAVPDDVVEEDAPAEDRVAALETEIGQLKDQLLRALAETENTRRRLQRERDDAHKYAVSGFARDMLSVADNLRRALDAIPAEAIREDEALKALADGVKLTEDELRAAFKRHGIEKIDPQGEKFDHNFHQAMLQVENSGHPAGTVAQVLAPGYTLHGRLLRPAMVGVAKGGDAEGGSQPKLDTTA